MNPLLRPGGIVYFESPQAMQHMRSLQNVARQQAYNQMNQDGLGALQHMAMAQHCLQPAQLKPPHDCRNCGAPVLRIEKLCSYCKSEQ